MREILFNRKVLILLLIGGTIGPVLDGFHVYSNTLAYTNPAVLKTAIWVFPLFASAVMSIGVSHLHFDLLTRRHPRKLSTGAVVGGLLAFVSIYYISGFWQTDSVTKSLVLASLGFGCWMIWERTWQGAFLALSTALIGCIVEILIFSTGEFYYLNPDFLGIPYWLFFLYIPASISVGNLSRKLYE